MDLVTEVSRIPHLGETILGTRFSSTPGGKGANQAVACARLGANVTMIGCIGDDEMGRQLVNNLKKERVNTDYIEVIQNVSSGIASITVQEGDNSIIVVPGANHCLTPHIIRRLESVIKKVDLILLSLEIPLETVETAVEIAHQNGIQVILNPAPAVQLPHALVEKVTVLTPNEHELAIVFGKDSSKDFRDLMASSPGRIVLTKGSEGAYYNTEDHKLVHVPSYRVEVVDTTGAGDAFNAGIALMLGQGKSISEATKYAVKIGAISVTKFGAQSGSPTKQEVEKFTEHHYSARKS